MEEIPPDANVEKICKQFELDGTRPRKFWHDIIKTDMGDLNQITFVTQLTPDRLERLRRVAESWRGPMAANFYVTPKKIADFMHAYCTDPVLQKRENIQLHVTQTEGLFYPSNIMRNIAVDPVKTKYVFLCDVDFVPIPGIEDIMQRYIRDGFVSDDKLIVIPAFEIKEKEIAHPKSKREVLDLLDKEKIQLMDIDHFDGAHKWTELDRWKTAEEPYIVQWREYFEPYVVMPKDKTPRYNPRFVGRIRDKITHLMIVSATGFKFHIVPDAYTVHMPHADSGMQSWDKAGLYAKCAIALYDGYKAELENKYNVKFT
ncbi:hypothetical protein CAPTEDRAFT_152623 [Capitella teleta]|uniref:Uncharacterized protein n=1 Tax=Capitella teleta TaxID=283909 RepID=R7T7U8_CAPTE|nr:hypothetical protein CAPTEDRAFT_152623 [Capitella teleta]|eukprot:ELT89685.1 hypothetical protein CAPTEDRAFT_152623 [Capitella teleta]